MEITDLIPDPDILLSLAPEELAGYVMEYLNYGPQTDTASINRYNFSLQHTVSAYPQNKWKPCQRALMEAWTVLEREGLVAHKPEEDGSWFFVTRRGMSLQTRNDYEAFRHASQFPKESVHPAVLSRVYPLFLRGDYETSIFQAFKLVEVHVRSACPGLGEKLYGVDLMRKAFHPENGPLSDTTEPVAEREALLALFAGAIGRFKNPASHKHVPITDAAETLEAIQFASHLLRIVDDRSTEESEHTENA
ncbi:TIGR02391 family protein [Marinobacter hydrocarbonoclasticus]|uniref:TIGR02391 family protein n=1 Tax=Marinobacter nauticus TaxID=2743 RepID=UPI001A8F63E8|nr:TIGR02391 family protein [Marinobacter nauticus]MBN8241360.1 TIGR02391 family protein [Marinobacter nauticus]